MDEMLEIGELPRQMGSLGQEPPEPEEGAHHGFLDLSRPLWVRGEPVDRLEYDFDALTAADLPAIDLTRAGLKGSPTNVYQSFTKEVKGAGTILEGLSADEAVKAIMDKLEAKFII